MADRAEAPLPDPRQFDGDWVIFGAGTSAAKIGEAVVIAVAMRGDERHVIFTIGTEAASIPLATLKRILG